MRLKEATNRLTFNRSSLVSVWPVGLFVPFSSCWGGEFSGLQPTEFYQWTKKILLMRMLMHMLIFYFYLLKHVAADLKNSSMQPVPMTKNIKKSSQMQQQMFLTFLWASLQASRTFSNRPHGCGLFEAATSSERSHNICKDNTWSDSRARQLPTTCHRVPSEMHRRARGMGFFCRK